MAMFLIGGPFAGSKMKGVDDKVGKVVVHYGTTQYIYERPKDGASVFALFNMVSGVDEAAKIVGLENQKIKELEAEVAALKEKRE